MNAKVKVKLVKPHNHGGKEYGPDSPLGNVIETTPDLAKRIQDREKGYIQSGGVTDSPVKGKRSGAESKEGDEAGKTGESQD